MGESVRSHRAGSVGDSVGDEKWSCSVCTYDNYRSATKCTICGNIRSLGRIEDAVLPERPPVSNILDEPDVNKWTCGTCTYANWPKSQFCVQCRLPKSIQVDTNARSEPADNEQQRQLSPLGVNQPSTSKTLDSRIVAKKLQKWTCHGCTYENWPKAHKCVLCYTHRVGGSVSPRLKATPQSPAGDGAQTPTGNESPKGGKRSLQGGNTQEGTGRKSPKSSPPPSSGSSSENIATAVASALKDKECALERQLRILRHQLPHHLDFLWLTAVRSVATSSCDCDPVEAYLAAGGDVTRGLTRYEVQLLESGLRGQKFDAGHTLIHLALRFHREDLVPLLVAAADPEKSPLSTKQTDGPASSGSRAVVQGRRVKRMPCHVSPDTAADIRRLVALSLRQRKGEFPCFYFSEYTTFSLPSSIYELSSQLQQRLFDEILDRGVQKELEEECAIINWSLEITDRLCSRLYALWNRTAGDCLLDSVLQATWGVFDSENSLRQALSDSLVDAGHVFYPRWREYETYLAKALQFSLDENQFARDWDLILRWASKPGSALEKVHVFALAHIMRRPIIVYGVRIVKSYRGEHLDYARFEGVYLPLLWEPTFCSRSPICLGYTLGHFVALIPMEPTTGERGAMGRSRERPSMSVYLPLQDADGRMLPVHFLTQNEVGHEQSMLRTWLDATLTDGGVMCCKMKLQQPNGLVDQMMEDWLDCYRRLGQMAALQQPPSSTYRRGVSQRISPAPPSPPRPLEPIPPSPSSTESKPQTKEDESSSSGEDSDAEPTNE